MTHRRSLAIALVAAVALALGIGALVGLRLTSAPGPGTSTDAPAAAVSGRTDGRSGTNTHGGSESVPEPSATPTTNPTPGSTTAPTTRGGVRVMPEAPGAATGGRLPGIPAAPSVPALPTWDDLPAGSTFASGRLVAGYPAALLPPAPRGSVVSSSLSPSPGRVQVALVARRAGGAAAVLRFYRDRLSRSGFAESTVAAGGAAAASAFRRGDNRVVVTLDRGARTYSVYAIFATGKA